MPNGSYSLTGHPQRLLETPLVGTLLRARLPLKNPSPVLHESRAPMGPCYAVLGLGLEESSWAFHTMMLCPSSIATMLEISPAIYRSENPENPKSLKKVSREEFGTPRPRTPKKSQKNPKSQEKSENQLFS